jgi:hypothetical protein
MISTALRIEWCYARARAKRFEEEVDLLQEEMWRTLAFLVWQAGWWLELGRSLSASSQMDIYSEGSSAYAEHQAMLHLDLHDYFKHMWQYVGDWVHFRVVSDAKAVEQEEEPDNDPFHDVVQ